MGVSPTVALPSTNRNNSNYYGPQIYELLGIGTGTSLKIIGISGTLSLLWTTSGLLSLDRVGRIKPLIVSAAGMAAALCVNSVMARYYVVSGTESTNGNALRAMVAMNFVFSLFFTYVGIISWVYPPEVSQVNPYPLPLHFHSQRYTDTLPRSSPPKSAPAAPQ